MILERTRAERRERLDTGLLHVFALTPCARSRSMSETAGTASRW